MPCYSPQNLRVLREQKHLSQDDVARRIGRSLSTFSRYENGIVVPSARILGAIAAVLTVPVGALFAPDDPVSRFDTDGDRELAAR
jgi:transcriptional regulator with XRE-family HTH domain